MRKITLLLMLVAMTLISYATVYYVDGSGGNDSNDGLSWANAFKTIGKARDTAADGDDIYIKGGTLTFTGAYSFNNRNYYGSFKGDESTPAQRPQIDVDGNGIIEAWEFEYPTVLSSTYNNGSAFSVPSNDIAINGFIFTHVATRTGAGTLRTVNVLAGFPGTFENNIIKDCNLTTTMTASVGGMLMTSAGVMKNCLFENNQTSCSSNVDQSVMLGVEALINSRISNCVFRNNRANADWSIGSTANANLRGFVLNLAPSNTVADKNIVTNCQFYNNEATFTGNSGNLTSTNGAIMVASSFSSSTSTDSIMNCTFANNKATNMKTAGLNVVKTNNTIKFVINNTFWNNKLDGNVKNLQIGTSLTSGYIGNNVMNGGAFNGNNTGLPSNEYCNNNKLDLSNNNAEELDTKAPRFRTPSTVVGYSNGGSVELAMWCLQEDSYLIGKGVTTSSAKDFDGISFQASPAAGAYEIKPTPVITWEQSFTTLKKGGSPVTLTASSSVAGGPSIVYTSSNNSVVSISGTTLTIVDEGTATITAKQAASKLNNEVQVQKSAIVDVVSGIESTIDNQLIIIVQNGIISNLQGQIDVISINGQQLKKVNANVGQLIAIPSGTYLIRISDYKDTVIQKIVLF